MQNMGGIWKNMGESMGFMGSMGNMGILVSMDTLLVALLLRMIHI